MHRQDNGWLCEGCVEAANVWDHASEGSFSFAAGASGPRLRGADIGFGDRNESKSGLASLTFLLITRFGLVVSKIRIQKYVIT